MPNYYDEVEIEDFAWDPVAKLFHYPCPCGDRFEISKGQLRDGEEIAICPSCSLILDWEDYVTDDEDEEGDEPEEESEEAEGTPRDTPTPPTDIEQLDEQVAKLGIKDEARGIGEKVGEEKHQEKREDKHEEKRKEQHDEKK
ncbi:hypothetical protein CI109_101589 [Kwoniella shandongensis]|uniref:Diphthamide biosynthesis protein 3 n=1 Tax=Kwoniella shandongensis TaxID=1734106 RepID=A0AAJ8LG55_9TREE